MEKLSPSMDITMLGPYSNIAGNLVKATNRLKSTLKVGGTFQDLDPISVSIF